MNRITRRGVFGAASAAPMADARATGTSSVCGGTLTLLLNPEAPYLLSEIDPSLQIGAITTEVMQGLLFYDLEMGPQPLLAARSGVAADGKPFRRELDPPAQGSDYLRSGEFIKQPLGRVDKAVEQRTGDSASYLRRWYTDYDFDTTIYYNGAFPDPAAGLQRSYRSKAAQRGVPSVAITGYKAPQMDRDFEDAQFQNGPN